jgi:hypothetical protein
MATFYWNDNKACFSNPGMGWVIHHYIGKEHKDYNEPDHYEQLDNVALLSWWAQLEPEENRFAFENLDDSVRRWTGLGKKLHFRISTDPMIYLKNTEGAPRWLYDHYPVPFQDRNEDNYLARFPDYLSADYQRAMRRFLCALADRYGDLPELETVDLRGYGPWGEWHSGYEYESYARRAAALRSVIDAWDYAFSGKKPLILSCSYEWMNNRVPPVHAPKSYEEYLYWSGFDYALRKPGISFRRDGIGGAVKVWDSQLMRSFYDSGKRLPMIAEFFGGYHAKASAHGMRGYYVEDSIEEALLLHPNYMMLMWDSVDFYEQRPDLIEYGLKRMGYRLIPRAVELPDVVQGGTYATVRHSWVNTGAGRFCSEGVLRVRIAGEVTEDTGFDPGVLSESEMHSFCTPVRIPAGLDAGSYPVEFSVRGYDGQVIRLPLDGETADGYYPVGTIRVEKADEAEA